MENGPVVQLVRIHACHAWGRGFESRPDRKNKLESRLFSSRRLFYEKKIRDQAIFGSSNIWIKQYFWGAVGLCIDHSESLR